MMKHHLILTPNLVMIFCVGMTHADDLPFLFNYELYPKFVPKSFPETTSKYFVKAWVTMATQG